MKKLIVVFLLIFNASYSQISGCTDSLAKNYNPKATNNDGNCLYETTKINPLTSIKLDNNLKETSGLIPFDNLFWTHNDDHDSTIYGLDSNGNIQKKIKRIRKRK